MALFVTRLVLGGMLLWSAAAKINRPYDFLGVVFSYQLVGPKLVFIVATFLPWLELVLGITLLAGILPSGSLILAVGLGLVFTYVEASALHRMLPISCGCFSMSHGSGTVNYATLSRAVFFLLFAIIGIACNLWRQKPNSAAQTRVQ
jgi:hypothetical protein